MLYELKCDQTVQGCEFKHMLKVHLMLLKAKDRLPLFLVVKHVHLQGGTARGILHYLPKNEPEVLDLVNCCEFWNKVSVIEPTTSRKKMFYSLPPITIECKVNSNFTDNFFN